MNKFIFRPTCSLKQIYRQKFLAVDSIQRDRISLLVLPIAVFVSLNSKLSTTDTEINSILAYIPTEYELWTPL